MLRGLGNKLLPDSCIQCTIHLLGDALQIAAACLRFLMNEGGLSVTDYEKVMLIIAIIALVIELLTFLKK